MSLSVEIQMREKKLWSKGFSGSEWHYLHGFILQIKEKISTKFSWKLKVTKMRSSMIFTTQNMSNCINIAKAIRPGISPKRHASQLSSYHNFYYSLIYLLWYMFNRNQYKVHLQYT